MSAKCSTVPLHVSTKPNVNGSVAEMTLQVTYSHHHLMQRPAGETCPWVDYDLQNKTTNKRRACSTCVCTKIQQSCDLQSYKSPLIITFPSICRDHNLIYTYLDLSYDFLFQR